MIRVQSPYATEPETFDTEDYGVDYGALHVFARGTSRPIKSYGPGFWAEVIPVLED